MHCSGTGWGKRFAGCCQRASSLNKRKWNRLILYGTGAVWRIPLSRLSGVFGDLRLTKLGHCLRKDIVYVGSGSFAFCIMKCAFLDNHRCAVWCCRVAWGKHHLFVLLDQTLDAWEGRRSSRGRRGLLSFGIYFLTLLGKYLLVQQNLNMLCPKVSCLSHLFSSPCI